MTQLKQKLLALITNDGLRAYLVAMGWEKLKESTHIDGTVGNWYKQPSPDGNVIFMPKAADHREFIDAERMETIAERHNLPQSRVICDILYQVESQEAREVYGLLADLLGWVGL